jgi:hypothetical protein
VREEEAAEEEVSRRLLPATALAPLALALLAPAAPAATIVANATSDNKTDDQLCTLREAVDAANTNAAVNPAGGVDCPAGEAHPAIDTIQLGDATYALTGADEDSSNVSGDLDVSAPSGAVVIAGEEDEDSTIDANDNDRAIEMLNAGFGTLTLRDLTIEDGTVIDEFGGLLKSSFAPVTLTRVTVSGGRSEGTNIGQLGGGGVLAFAGLTVTDSRLTLNALDADSAGAGSAQGGAVLASGPVLIERTTFDENGVFGVAGQTGRGGALAMLGSGSASDLTIRDSTIAGNGVAGATTRIGGGVSWMDTANDDTLLVENSTFSQNTVGTFQNGGGLHIQGGAAGTNRIAFTTFGATSPTTMNGAGYYLESGGVQVRGSLFATGTEDDCNAGTSLGHNVEQLTSGDDCHFNQPTDVLTSFAVLDGAGIDDHGGPTPTEKLEFGGNPAIDHVPAASCLGVSGQPLADDQRGVPRPDDGDGDPDVDCDVGSYELSRCQGVIVNRVADPGDDGILEGTAGADGILGLEGDDAIRPGDGPDVICAGDGDDTFIENDSVADDFDGGPGADEISTTGFTVDTVDLPAQTATTGAETDVLASVENAATGFQNDVLIGDAGPNVLEGSFDDDTITGGAGVDRLLGFSDTDTLFARDGSADVVDCGDDTDTAQTDQPSLDPTAGCESVDALAEPVFPGATPPGKKKKKCKKGRKLKRGKCVKKKRKK